jgi:Rrf2 family protein
MRFAKTTEYAIRVMVYLADHRDGLYSVNKLHKLLNVPYKYLGRLMSKLAVAGLVEAVQGKQGGFKLNAHREPIFLSEIIDTVEGLEDYDRCVLGFESCSDENPCSLHKFWLDHLKGINKMLHETSLKDLSEEGVFKY